MYAPNWYLCTRKHTPTHIHITIQPRHQLAPHSRGRALTCNIKTEDYPRIFYFCNANRAAARFVYAPARCALPGWAPLLCSVCSVLCSVSAVCCGGCFLVLRHNRPTASPLKSVWLCECAHLIYNVCMDERFACVICTRFIYKYTIIALCASPPLFFTVLRFAQLLCYCNTRFSCARST